MTAKGKINASNVQAGDRIIVKTVETSEGTYLVPSATKTGENVFIARVIGKTFRAAQGRFERRGKYVIETSAGSFDAVPIQTMFLAPEDAAGIKRAHAEAMLENSTRPASTSWEIVGTEKIAEQAERAEQVNEVIETATQAERTADAIVTGMAEGYGPDEIAEIEKAITSATPKTINFIGLAVFESWNQGKMDAATHKRLGSMIANKGAEWKAPEAGDILEWRGSDNAHGVVMKVEAEWVTVDWSHDTTHHHGRDRMPSGEFHADWKIMASKAWEPRAARCANEWHRTAPARGQMLCPECPA